MKPQFKLSDLLGWVVVMFIIFLIGLLVYTLTKPEEKQGRLIKPFPKNTTRVNPHPECGWCAVVKTYSLNVNNKHIGSGSEIPKK